MRVLLCSAWVLHTRAYQNSSLLVELFTAEQGRVCGVLRGGRRRGRTAAPAQALRPLLASWSGRGDLKTLSALEEDGPPLYCRGWALLAALHVNELVYRLLHRHEPHPNLFVAYLETLQALERGEAGNWEGAVLAFEFRLLRELGYGIDFEREASSGTPLAADAQYSFEPGQGFARLGAPAEHEVVFPGAVLQRLAAGDFADARVRNPARALSQRALAATPGGHLLQSRRLLRRLQHGESR